VTSDPTLFVRKGASGTVVRGVAITGPSAGMVLSGSKDVELDAVWIHDTADRGIDVESTLGATSLSVHDSLFEKTSSIGIYSSGAATTIERTVFRDTRPKGGQLGRAINARAASLDIP